MKVRNLLIAALLLGGMTAFNACSDKDEDPTPDQGTEQPAEELDTYLAVAGGFGDKIETRAGDEVNDGNLWKKGYDYEIIRNYAEVVFEVGENNEPGKVLAYYVNKSGSSANPIFGKRDEFGDKKYVSGLTDKYGFYLQPLKFKTAAKKVAVIIVANCDEMFNGNGFKEENGEPTFSNFEEFTTYANTVDLPLMKNQKFGGYPMSSNVYIVDIVPGKYNSVGFGNNGDGQKQLKEALEHYEMNYSGDISDIHVSNQKRFYLYRCWSLVKLTTLKVATYTEGATDAKFEFEGAFVMNVPTRTNLFNPGKKVDASEGWYAWGGDLNVDLTSYLKQNSGKNLFYSGYSADNTTEDLINSDDVAGNPAYDKGFRTKKFADATIYFSNYTRSLKETETFTKNETLDLTLDKFKGDNTSLSIDNAMGEDNYFTYIVAPSTYGLDGEGKQVSDQSIVLAVKGKYSQKIGDKWIGANESTYYTVVINGDDSATTEELYGATNVENTVMRNVQYEIEMTVKGPGSPDPVHHLANSYLVPKVTIVPFGKVTQHSEID